MSQSSNFRYVFLFLLSLLYLFILSFCTSALFIGIVSLESLVVLHVCTCFFSSLVHWFRWFAIYRLNTLTHIYTHINRSKKKKHKKKCFLTTAYSRKWAAHPRALRTIWPRIKQLCSIYLKMAEEQINIGLWSNYIPKPTRNSTIKRNTKLFNELKSRYDNDRRSNFQTNIKTT